MKRSKGILACIMTACLIATLISGCSSSNATNSNTANNNGTNVSKGKTKLIYSYWGDALEKKTTEALLKKFMDSHPDIEVEGMQIPYANYLTKLNTMAASNTLPDVANMMEPNALQWADKNMFVDLTDMYSTGKIAKKLDSTIFKLNGRIIGSSVADEIMVLYYNKDIFKEAGVETPPADAENAWTFDKFVETAKKLTKDKNGKHPDEAGFDEKNIVTYGVNWPTQNMEWYWIPMAVSNGGGLVSQDASELLLDKPETIEAIQSIADLANKHHVAPSPAQASTIPTLDTAFLSKKVAMAVDGQWSCQVLGQAKKDQNLNFGIGVLPKFKTPATTNTGTPIVIFKTSKNVDASKQFFTFIMDPNESIENLQSGVWMANEEKWYKDSDLIKKWTDNPIHVPEYKTAVIDYALKYTSQEPWYFCPTYTRMMDSANASLSKVWLGTDTAQNVIKKEIMPTIKPIFDSKKAN